VACGVGRAIVLHGETPMRGSAVVACIALGLVVASAWPQTARAQEVGFTVGRFLGDDLLERVPLLSTSGKLTFEDGGLYGGRIVMGALLVQLEGSILYTPTALVLGTRTEVVSAKFLYAEASGLISLLPGPIAPFLAAGLGYHRIGWGGDGLSSYNTLGYNVGVGLKVGLGGLGVRTDLRDHITPMKVDKMDPRLVDLLGLESNVTLHNFEISATLLVHF